MEKQKHGQWSLPIALLWQRRKIGDLWKGAYEGKWSVWWESCFSFATGQTGKYSRYRSCIKCSGCIQDGWGLDNVLLCFSFICFCAMMGNIYQAPLTILSELWSSVHLLSPALGSLPFCMSSLSEECPLQKFGASFLLHVFSLKVSGEVWLCCCIFKSVRGFWVQNNFPEGEPLSAVCCLSLLGLLWQMWGESGEVVFVGLGDFQGTVLRCARVAHEIGWEAGIPEQGMSLFLVADQVCAHRFKTSQAVCWGKQQGANGGIPTAVKVHRTGCSLMGLLG